MTYLRFEAADLPGNVGTDREDRSRHSDGCSGHLTFGPYFQGQAGIYVAGFYMRRTSAPTDGQMILDAVVDGVEVARRPVLSSDLFDDIASLVHLEFELREPASRIEVRLYVEEGVLVEVQSLVIFQTRARSWGGL